MGLSYKRRRLLALLVLVAGLPAYIIAVVSVLSWIGRPAFWVELAVYVVLGVLWVLPLKFLFTGIGKADPRDGG